ncbi:MAG: peptidoglycan DD-metalloendopeptidase family protein [Parcubacteria group bacterium]
MALALFKRPSKMGSSLSVVKISTFLGRNYIVLSMILTSFLIPLQTQAGVFSFISDLFSFESAEAQEVEVNSQNIHLLQASLSPNHNYASTTDDLAIVGGTSLSSESHAPIDVKTFDDDQISVYVVRNGDTLPAIAKMFGVSVNTIRWGNDISGNTVSVGQTLVILPISGVQHTVKSGDTLQSIAKQHKGDLDEILQYNNLTKNAKLIVGDVIVVPDGEMTTSVNKPSSGGKPSSVATYSGYYMRPIKGGVKTQGIHGHNGVDLASVFGSNILASADGDVIVSKNSGWNGGYGSYIVIKHSNGTQTLYAHLSGTNVSVGDRVAQGQVIGKMGSTGKSTGTHLHFEIRGAKNPF